MYRWLLTPQFLDLPEPVLGQVVPGDTVVNGPHDISDRSPESMARVHHPILDFVNKTLADGNCPVSVAGDCCASIPVLAGVQNAHNNPVLVWIDAHGDFNTPETSPSQFLGGMPLAMIVGRGPKWMCAAVGLVPIAEDRVWLIDGRDLDPKERVALDASAVRRTGMAGLGTLRVNAPVHLHLDIDVIDLAEAPGCNYPVAHGPSVAQTVAMCRAFANTNQIVAISISGWTGSLDSEGKTQAACAQILQALTA
jgi:arginase